MTFGFKNGVSSVKNISFDGGTTTIATNGQLIIGNTGNNPSISTLTAGSGIAIANGAGSITISASAGGFTWSNISASQALVANNGYFCSGGGALALSLPTTSAVGDTIQVALNGSTSWTITQAAGQQIRFGNQTTTLGAGGSLASNQQGDCVEIVCMTANTIWVAIDSTGGLTVT